jgi:hypothetical protein
MTVAVSATPTAIVLLKVFLIVSPVGERLICSEEQLLLLS